MIYIYYSIPICFKRFVEGHKYFMNLNLKILISLIKPENILISFILEFVVHV